MTTLYADIVVPVARDFFTFRVGDELVPVLEEGMGVAVQLGPRKIYMGIVWRLTTEKPPYKNIRNITKIVYPERVVSGGQMRLWEWMAEYYMCTLGEVMRFAVPAALKPTGMSVDEFADDQFRPTVVKYISLHPLLRTEDDLRAACEAMGRAKAQYKALMEFCALASGGDFSDGGDFAGAESCFGVQVRRDRLPASDAVIAKMAERGVFVVEKREPVPQEADVAAVFALPELTAAQRGAFDEINAGFTAHGCVLLHGVTGSGKTEIYTHLMAAELAAGRSVLYMLPEIAMTSQLVARIRRVFGDRVTVYHSRMTDRQRAEAYRKLSRSTGGELVLGVRSSVLLPMPSPGLVIVDEEHDASYKQNENNPRYNARDCAVYMARLWGARCLLASATPSIESYVNATGGKYGLVTLRERYGDAQLPEIIVSDTISAVKRGERKVHFNKVLLDKMRAALEAGRQVMLFQNRRAFAPYVECEQCGWTARCPRCSVSLSYHKGDNTLRCHVCGYSTAPFVACPTCGSAEIKPRGFGTEKVEEELAKLFPEATIARLDRDTAESRRRFERIISDFENHRTDILVGTQMITKGFDFSGVSLVGILNADNLLNYPDFRASERAYQIMTQVAGRAGRAAAGGEVVIQTSQPANTVIQQVRTGDYEGMVRDQLAEREPFGYPPYGRLMTVILKHRDAALLEAGAWRLAERMRGVFRDRVYGPHAPVIEKISNENILTILLKVENGRSASRAKELLAGIISEFTAAGDYRTISVSCNVDPQ